MFPQQNNCFVVNPKMLYLVVFILLLTFGINETTNAQVPCFQWIRSGGGTDRDEGIDLAIDSSGNIYVVGRFIDTATFSDSTLQGVGTQDVFIAKYNSIGDLLWMRHTGGVSSGGSNSGANGVLGITLDLMENPIITGYYIGTIIFGHDTLDIGGANEEMFLVKYDQNGDVTWAKAATGSFSVLGYSVATDATGNIFVTGYFGHHNFSGDVTFNPTLNSAGGSDIFVAKYDQNGNVLWANRAGSSNTGNQSRDLGTSIAVDGSGNALVTGVFSGSADFSGTTLNSTGDRDIFIAKYNSDGDLLWAKLAGGMGLDSGGGITSDNLNNIFLVGRFEGSAAFDALTLNSAGGADIFVAKYSSNGIAQWASRAGSNLPLDPTKGADGGSSIVIGSEGNIFITGLFDGTADFGSTNLTSAGGDEIFVAKYDGNGNALWAKRAGSDSNEPDADRGSAVDVDDEGNIVVTGRFVGIADFDTTNLTSIGSQDFFLAKLKEPVILINEIVTDPQQDWTDNDGGNSVSFDLFPGTGTITTTDEWLELYNAGPCAIDFTEGTGWMMNFIDGSDATLDFQNPGSTQFVFSNGGSLTNFQPGEYLVIGNPPGSMNNDIFIQLINASGTVIDDVELGDDPENDGNGDGAADGSGTGGNATSIANEVVARLPNAIDTNNDVDDFVQQHTTIGFSNDANFDFGDAPTGGGAGSPPDSYPTLLIDNGARHLIDGITYMGTTVDAEPDGQPDATATDDDTTGIPDDEDGVVFSSFITPGNNATVDITAAVAGKLNAWIDFNQDGDWEDGDEQIFTNQELNAGLNNGLTYSVPVSALQGSTFGRFRFNSTGDLSFDGPALDGEVEDYKVDINIIECMLTPPTDTNQVNTQHSVTVTVEKDGVGLPGINVTFDIFKGPNAAIPDGVETTDANGQATFLYTGGATIGTDSIKATGTTNGVSFVCYAEKVWKDDASPPPTFNWIHQFTGPRSLFSVWGSAPNDVFAVGGTAGTESILHYNGTNWSTQVDGVFPLRELAFVWGTSSTDVFTGGGQFPGQILHYDGNNWSAQFDADHFDQITGIWGFSPTDVFAVTTNSSTGKGRIYHFDGNNWTQQLETNTNGEQFKAVWGSSSSNVFAVGDNGIIFYYNGVNWSQQNSGVNTFFRAIWGSSATDVFAIGGNGVILHFDGNSWSQQFSPTNKQFLGIWGVSSTEILAVGDPGQDGDLHYYNGNSWLTLPIVSSEPLTGIWGSSLNDIFIVGQFGGIFHGGLAGTVNCFISPTTDTNQVNTQHSVTVTVQKDGIAQQGISVTFEIFEGPNAAIPNAVETTDANGQATFTYTGGATVGKDSVKASGTFSGTQFECFTEKVWVNNQCLLEAESDTNQVGTSHSVTVTVKQNGTHIAGIPVTFEVFKGPNSNQSGPGNSPTDGSGQATFTYTSNGTVGTDSIKATGTINGIPFVCFAEKIWLNNLCFLTPATDTNFVDMEHTLTLIVQQNGSPVEGVEVNFDVFKGPNVGLPNGVTTTNNLGQAVFTYSGTTVVGTDSIKAFGEINGVPFDCFAEKIWIAKNNFNDKIAPTAQMVFFNFVTNQFSFELAITNTFDQPLFAPLIAEFISILPAPPVITIANSDGGGDGVGSYYDYSNQLGGDGKLDPGETSQSKLWLFNDPSQVNFIFFADVFGVVQSPSPIAKPNNQPIKFVVNIQDPEIEIITAVDELLDPLPTSFKLYQNYPNPFNPETTIQFDLPQATGVVISIYNLQGQLVRTLLETKKEAGFHEIIWNARDETGKIMSSGVYLYRIEAGEYMEVRKLMLLR